MLRNVSLHLNAGYEIIASTRAYNIHLYYELATVILIGNAHGVNVIINVPLKTASQHFTSYKIIVLPARISASNFVKYSVDFSIFRH
jgi:hypothetical protein